MTDVTPASRPDTAMRWRRILVTLGAIAVFRLGSYLQVPGLVPEMVEALNHQPMAGIARERLSIMALGVMPWFNALILAELATLLIPAARRWRAMKTAPGFSFDRAVMGLAIAFAIFQALGLANAMQNVIWLVLHPGPAFTVSAALSVLGGTAIAMWLAALVTHEGIGSGFWVMMVAPILLGLPAHVAGYANLIATGQVSTAAAALSLLIAIGSIAFVALLLLRRTAEGLTNATDVIWPPLLASAAVSWVSVLPWLLPDPHAQEMGAKALAPGEPAALALLAVFIALFVWLYARLTPAPGLGLLTGVILTAVMLAPELALTYLGVPMLMDGRWIVATVAVLFTFARLWQRPVEPTPAGPL